MGDTGSMQTGDAFEDRALFTGDDPAPLPEGERDPGPKMDSIKRTTERRSRARHAVAENDGIHGRS